MEIIFAVGLLSYLYFLKGLEYFKPLKNYSCLHLRQCYSHHSTKGRRGMLNTLWCKKMLVPSRSPIQPNLPSRCGQSVGTLRKFSLLTSYNIVL